MKKNFNLVALVAISLLFVQCEQNEMENASGKHNGHKYVDLGLPSGLKWATCNVGATVSTDFGDYFAWGEVEPKDYYDWSTYKYGTDKCELTKYCITCGKDGFTDYKTILDPEDDAATVNWGGKWRIPTYDEMDELQTKCTWTWTTQNGVKGYKVTGPNGNSIFFPAAGCMDGSSLYGAGSYGSFWSNSLFLDLPYLAYKVRFHSDNVYWFEDYRSRGQSVRPVCQ